MAEKAHNNKHITVLLEEAVEALEIKEGDVVVDATLGAGGHTLKILGRVGQNGKVIAFDLDRKAIEEFISRNEFAVEKTGDDIYVIKDKPLILVHSNFKNIKKIITGLYSTGDLSKDQVNGVLADLGWRLEQVQEKKYGMSFHNEAPLDMRFDLESDGLTARQIVNEWTQQELENIFRELGGETYSNAKRIAGEIIEVRKKREIDTTVELAELIAEVRTENKIGINPATKVFQALRIAVNEELSNLNKFLESSFDVLEKEGRLAIISFHSLEDRLVKNFFRAKARGCVCPKEIPVCVCGGEREIKIISSRPLRAGKTELKLNPRARSASLRIAQKIKNKNKK